MRWIRYKLFIFILVTTPCFASSDGSLGIGVDVEVSGYFSPSVENMIVQSIQAGSLAELAGLMVGDKVISINSCDIPGCSVSYVRRAMDSNEAGNIEFLVEREHGSTLSLTVVK